VECTNASKKALGGVLIQDGHIICYEYRKLKEHEKNYATHDLELAKIIHAFKMWRHYLIGRKFQRRTYNVSLKYLFDKPNINARQARCLTLISEYVFEISHIKGKAHIIVGALSKKLNQISKITIINWSTNLAKKVKTTTNFDLDYVKIKEKL